MGFNSAFRGLNVKIVVDSTSRQKISLITKSQVLMNREKTLDTPVNKLNYEDDV